MLFRSDKVAKQVTSQVAATNLSQDGFEAVNNAAQTMAALSGGKKKKTRKFRLTKKNKTKGHKK